MGRLFQYNRFGTPTSTNNKKDNSTRAPNNKAHKSVSTATAAEEATSRTTSKCPLYAELYAAYNTRMTCNTTANVAQSPASTTPTAKNMEFVYKKYQQWGNKILTTMTPIQTAATTTHTGTLLAPADDTNSRHRNGINICMPANGKQEAACDNEESGDASEDTVKLLGVATTKRPRVYDCMKDFLRRKFFQLPAAASEKTKTSQTSAKNGNATKIAHHAEDEDVTSDYDELDILDSSYNADEEDATDCSCSYNSDAEESPACIATENATPSATGTKGAQKSLLSLNCWHAAVDSSSSSCSQNDSTSDDDGVAATAKHQQLNTTAHDDSDAGISDCCQLLPAEQLSPSRRRPKRLLRKKQRKSQQRQSNHTLDQLDVPDLMAASWYQPCITAKAATAQLQAASAGNFLIRRKARNFELCLRTANKIKCYTVIGHESGYFKLKGARKQFSTLKALVTHHSVMPEQLPLPLLLPRSAEHTPHLRISVRCADDFVGIESLEILDMLKCLQAKHQQ